MGDSRLPATVSRRITTPGPPPDEGGCGAATVHLHPAPPGIRAPTRSGHAGSGINHLGAVSAAATLNELTAVLRSDPARSAILLDVDGTLAPVVRDPEQASVPELLRRQLLLVTERYGFVACVS